MNNLIEYDKIAIDSIYKAYNIPLMLLTEIYNNNFVQWQQWQQLCNNQIIEEIKNLINLEQ